VALVFGVTFALDVEAAFVVKRRPWRAARVGSTQSIMSTPMRAYCSISSG